MFKFLDKILRRPSDVNEEADTRTTCPGCGNDKFFEGPHGGASVNVKCTQCGKCWCCAPGTPLAWVAITDAGVYGANPKEILEL